MFSRNPDGFRDCAYIYTYRQGPIIIPGDYRSTHGDEPDPLGAFIAGNTRALWVEDRLTVHQETIPVVENGWPVNSTLR